ncbi:MAG: alanine--tRNA ligase, partial [Bacteroidales bacterium]|nr:alanine--tRNA ligase [Bacteroidales bacterium]
PFICRLVPRLVEDMGEAYPEITAQQKLIENVIREEENAFLRTLDRGIKLMDDYLARNASTKVIPGIDAFVLYDTYGFPIDLTGLIAEENGFTVDMEGFQVELGKQKERARNATANTFGDWTVCHDGDEVVFTGYDETVHEGSLLLRSRTVVEKKKEMLQLVFDFTPFYGEMGGEVGDTGTIVSASGEEIRILNTIKENGLTIHVAEKMPSDSEGPFTLKVDAARRTAITSNHSATHLLDNALRQVLGTHVEQKGSFVGPDYLRFDFSHFSKMTDEEIEKTEDLVNSMIRADFPLQEFRETSMDDAREMGAIALFGEKYGDKVRVVRFGPSVELCGGCHAPSTGRIGLFKIVSESAIAAGVRRIEAVTGTAAEQSVRAMQKTLKGIREMFNNVPDIHAAIAKMMEQNSEFKKQVEDYARKAARQAAEALMEKAEKVGGYNVIRFTMTQDPQTVRDIAAIISKITTDTVFAAAFESGGKPNLVLAYSEDLAASGKNAGKDIREAAKFIQGGGGGQPQLATAGGRDVAGLAQALEAMIDTATK